VGEGQYRLSLGRWRFRYDVAGRVVLMTYCGLRREDTYQRPPVPRRARPSRSRADPCATVLILFARETEKLHIKRQIRRMVRQCGNCVHFSPDLAWDHVL
jgi:hypothetical protein